MVTAGPGATNALTGTMNAWNNNSAVLTISGEIPAQYYGKGYLQEGAETKLDINAIYRNATQYSSLVSDPSNFQTLFTQALRDTRSLPAKASHIGLPNNIAATSLKNVQFPKTPANYRATPCAADQKQVEAAFLQLHESKKPLIFIGNGTRQALRDPERLARFQQFIEKFAIPVMTTPDGKGIFPESHPYSLRNYGFAACEWPVQYLEALNEAGENDYDCLMVLGSVLGQLSTVAITNGQRVNWNPVLVPSKTFIQVDLDQSIISRGFPVNMGIVAEISAFIDQMLDFSENYAPIQPNTQERIKLIEKVKENSPYRDPAKMDNTEQNPMYPQALMKAIGQALEQSNTTYNIFSDCANCVGWTLQYLTVDPPHQIHYSLAMGPMGFGVCAVIGGKLGAPDTTCLAVVGDAAFMMQGSEVSTANRYKTGAVWVVLCDNDMGMVSQGMAEFFPESGSWENYYTLGNPDIQKFGESLGAQSYKAHSVEEVNQLLTQCIKDANATGVPQVIAAYIDIKEVPPYYALKQKKD
jgi:acetolactate synthase-1/2/3 large subunit